MSEIKVDTVGPRVDNGTLTIGAAGDTVNIAGTAGTGFGAALTGSTNNTVVTVTGANAIQGEANLNFDGNDLTLGNGNVVFGTASKGIYLGVTSATAANLLDDYEEGTWTPNVANATVSSSTGHYTKIGNICYITIQLALSAIGSGNPSQISGLPFAASGTSNRNGLIGMVDSRNNSTSTVELHLRSDTGSSLLIFVGKESDVANYDDDLNVMADSFSVNGSGWYTTA